MLHAEGANRIHSRGKRRFRSIATWCRPQHRLPHCPDRPPAVHRAGNQRPETNPEPPQNNSDGFGRLISLQTANEVPRFINVLLRSIQKHSLEVPSGSLATLGTQKLKQEK